MCDQCGCSSAKMIWVLSEVGIIRLCVYCSEESYMEKLDKWIAENIFAHLPDEVKYDIFGFPLRYSTSIAAAWGVVEYLIKTGRYDLHIEVDMEETIATFEHQLTTPHVANYSEGKHKLTPMAICLAAYKLKTGKGWEDS